MALSPPPTHIHSALETFGARYGVIAVCLLISYLVFWKAKKWSIPATVTYILGLIIGMVAMTVTWFGPPLLQHLYTLTDGLLGIIAQGH